MSRGIELSRRLLLALALLVLVGGGALAVAALRAPEPGEAGAYPVEVVGPDGVLYAGRVEVEDATALGVLRAAGLRLETVDYPGMGTYVLAVEGHAARGAAGWVYEVLRGGAWRSGDRSADAFPLHAGDEVRWSWTEG